MQTIGIVGLGLIGGSLAKTIKLHTPYTVYGYDISAETMQRAFLMEAIDGELTADKRSSIMSRRTGMISSRAAS